jgi:hypothetical protein
MTDQLVRHKAAGLVSGLLLLLVITGCSSTRIASTGNDLAAVNLLAEGRVARVTLAGGEVVRARALLIETDSVSWVDAGTGEFKMAATPQLREVRFTRHGRGAVQGAGLGAAIVGGYGALLMAASWTPTCESTEYMGCFLHGQSAAQAALWGALVGIVGGLPFGAVAGWSVGARSIYVIDLPAPDGPPAQVADAVDPEPSEPMERE